MQVRLNKRSLDWLYDKRLFLQGYRRNGDRLKPGQFLRWLDHIAAVEPYIGLYAGDAVPTIGAFSYCHSALPWDITIGRYCSISWDVKFPGPRHPLELLTTAGFMIGSHGEIWSTFLADTGTEFNNTPDNPQKPPIKIGHDVWIGQDVSVMRGITIGNGAVIASSAVVTRDVEPYAIVGGNPARFIKWRFPEDVRDDLQDLRWWRYSYPILNRIDLSDVVRSMRDLRSELIFTEAFEPPLIDLREMPHEGIIA